FLQYTALLAGVTAESIGTLNPVVHYGPPNPHTGLFMNAGASDNPGTLARLATVVYALRVVNNATGNRLDGRWFRQGLAEWAAATVVRGRYPEAVDAVWQSWLAALGRAQIRNTLVPYSQLE